MEKKELKFYAAPAIEVVELELSSSVMLVASGGGSGDGGEGGGSEGGESDYD